MVAKAGELPEVDFFPFSKEEMAIIVAPDHHFTKKRSIAFKDLANEPFIMKEQGSGTRKLVEELFSDADFAPDILMETSNT